MGPAAPWNQFLLTLGTCMNILKHTTSIREMTFKPFFFFKWLLTKDVNIMRRKNIIISFYLNIGSVDLVAFPKNGQIHMVGLRLSVKDYKANKKLRHFKPPINNMFSEKSRIRETKNLSTDADSRTGKIFERLHDVSKKNK